MAISEDDFNEIFDQCCIGIDLKNDTPIYRYVEDIEDKFTLVDPRRVERKSANTLNYYTLFIDNDPVWKDFPRRKFGVVSALNNSYFGNDFRVIPLNKYDDILKKYNIKPFINPKWGICPTFDIWSSIKKNYETIDKEYDMNADDILMFFYNIANTYDVELSQSDYNLFKKQLIDLSDIYNKYKSKLYGNYDNGNNDSIQPILNFMEKQNMNFFDLFQYIFDPKLNEFEIKSYEELKNMTGNNEIWTATPVIYLNMKHGEMFW
jgi:hypothetical protein